jgi:hypothetical protein
VTYLIGCADEVEEARQQMGRKDDAEDREHQADVGLCLAHRLILHNPGTPHLHDLYITCMRTV